MTFKISIFLTSVLVFLFNGTTFAPKTNQLKLKLKFEHIVVTIVVTIEVCPSKRGDMDSLPPCCSSTLGNSNAQMFFQKNFILVIC
jgi:hypothetical protein